MTRYLFPLTLFLCLAALLGRQLGKAPQPLPSTLLDKPAPPFSAPQLDSTRPRFTPQALQGKVWLMNVWASWCASCRAEHALLLDISQREAMPIVGLNHEDEAPSGRSWLAQRGNPYAWTPQDRDGRIGMEWGVYGVPETFVIDKQGRVRLRHAGPLTPDVWQQTLQPLIEALNRD